MGSETSGRRSPEHQDTSWKALFGGERKVRRIINKRGTK